MPPNFIAFFCAFTFVSNVYCTNSTSVCNGSCVRKCCETGQQLINGSCMDSSNDFFHPLKIPIYRKSVNLTEVSINDSNIGIMFGYPCEENEHLFPLNPEIYPSEKYYILEDGSLFTPELYDYAIIPRYCLEAFGDTLSAFVCMPVKPTYFLWYSLGMIISLPFLVLTIFVYAVVLELRTLHGKSLICHTSMLFTAYLFLAIVKINGETLSDKWCVFFALAIQFSFLASFFWLNVMCFDIWLAFSKLRPHRGTVKEREHKKFIIYSLYAWGCPFIVFIITAMMDFCKCIPETVTKPRIGVTKCWFSENGATLLYFYFPIGVLLVLNTIMFLTTACRLKTYAKDTKVLKGEESKRHYDCDRHRFKLYLKLFIVMGINWMMELVSFALEGTGCCSYLWYVSDLFNSLQGVAIFLIFVLKRRVLSLLNHKLCPKLQLISAASTTPRPTSTLSTDNTNN